MNRKNLLALLCSLLTIFPIFILLVFNMGYAITFLLTILYCHFFIYLALKISNLI